MNPTQNCLFPLVKKFIIIALLENNQGETLLKFIYIQFFGFRINRFPAEVVVKINPFKLLSFHTLLEVYSYHCRPRN